MITASLNLSQVSCRDLCLLLGFHNTDWREASYSKTKTGFCFRGPNWWEKVKITKTKTRFCFSFSRYRLDRPYNMSKNENEEFKFSFSSNCSFHDKNEDFKPSLICNLEQNYLSKPVARLELYYYSFLLLLQNYLKIKNMNELPNATFFPDLETGLYNKDNIDNNKIP